MDLRRSRKGYSAAVAIFLVVAVAVVAFTAWSAITGFHVSIPTGTGTGTSTVSVTETGGNVVISGTASPYNGDLTNAFDVGFCLGFGEDVLSTSCYFTAETTAAGAYSITIPASVSIPYQTYVVANSAAGNPDGGSNGGCWGGQIYATSSTTFDVTCAGY